MRTNDKSDLELLHTVTNGDKLGGTPDETFHLDGKDRLLELRHVGLIIPGLDLKGNNGL